jgi:hypothetical protein
VATSGGFGTTTHLAGRIEESVGKRADRDAAERLLKIREADVAKGLTTKPGQLRFEQAAADLLIDYRINRRRSLKDVAGRIAKHMTPGFRGRRMATISPAEVRLYIEHRQRQGAANASINRELAALKRMFSLAIQAGKLIQQTRFPLLTEDNARKGFFERAQFEAVRANLTPPLQAVATFDLTITPAGAPRARFCRCSGIRSTDRPASCDSNRARRRTRTVARFYTRKSTKYGQ